MTNWVLLWGRSCSVGIGSFCPGRTCCSRI